MDSVDALIVGGGPAGSTCARSLRSQGLDVMLIDKAKFPRDKVCAGWITLPVVDALELDLAAYSDGNTRTLQAINGFRTGLIGGGQHEIRYPDTVSYGIRRVEFDDYLLRRANVPMRLNESVTSIERKGVGQATRWVINGHITTPLLVGAGGNFCPVARFLNGRTSSAHGGETSLVTAKEIEFRMDARQLDGCQIEPDTPELYFSKDMKGYGWCLRKGDHLNVGLGREDVHGLPQHLEQFHGFLRSRGRISWDLPTEFHGHAYRLYGHAPRRLLDDGVMLLGDAAGLASTQSGEGIRPAVDSALLAAEVISTAAGNYLRSALEPYRHQLLARFGQPSVPSSGVVSEFLRQAVGRASLGSRWFVRNVVLDRWFLQTQLSHQPIHQPSQFISPSPLSLAGQGLGKGGNATGRARPG